MTLPKIPIPHALRIEETVDKPANLIERALSECDKRIETGEAACVKSALITQKVMLPNLIAMLHGCHQGEVCHYAYTTDDQVGLFHATSSHFIVHWRVDFDLTHPVGALEAVPVTVVRV
ncbi:hypothetical protein [Lichenifustis flavocetrariae]|uniref:Uncharacterized protein n=1 Tax=Lichenifustis flavocetrariae TaxID=2949735 RepID=A0AA41Z2Y2_9HYPH|nr:hypothetical protein [Lichenifustis flavocetrariae]MCW6508322.1 hypothetical protein [Lichenifustis flavocetrariae]